MAKVRGLSDILTFFRRNETPIFFVSPTAFNLLGVEKFINRFYHINYFDSFDGAHPRVFVPDEKSHDEFESMEDVCNYMLQHKQVIDRISEATFRFVFRALVTLTAIRLLYVTIANA